VRLLEPEDLADACGGMLYVLAGVGLVSILGWSGLTPLVGVPLSLAVLYLLDQTGKWAVDLMQEDPDRDEAP